MSELPSSAICLVAIIVKVYLDGRAAIIDLCHSKYFAREYEKYYLHYISTVCGASTFAVAIWKNNNWPVENPKYSDAYRNCARARARGRGQFTIPNLNYSAHPDTYPEFTHSRKRSRSIRTPRLPYISLIPPPPPPTAPVHIFTHHLYVARP